MNGSTNHNSQIRNFAIISHIDHGKSTLADRFLEITGAVEGRKMRDRFLDNLDLEREHGVTIKMQAARMEYEYNRVHYVLNLIDTPGHVDFGYEVSRALAACEGALLLVDASQGIQAQTLSTATKALEQNVVLIPVINKIDLPNVDLKSVSIEFCEMFGFRENEIIYVSGKTGQNVDLLLEKIIQLIPSPQGESDKPLQAMVFDSVYSEHRGVIAYVKVVEGTLIDGVPLKYIRGGVEGKPVEIGYIRGEFDQVHQIQTGEVGYIATGFKDIQRAQVGDTVTLASRPAAGPLTGYKKIKPMVYASLYPVNGDDYESFRKALEKLSLNDASLQYIPENSTALGFGFRIGFLGTFHAEIIKERLEREFGLDLIITVPTVEYQLDLTDGSQVSITSPADLPEPTKIKTMHEPWVEMTILTPPEYLSSISQLVGRSRGSINNVQNTLNHLTLKASLPLAEIISSFHDDLKSLTAGFASFDYDVVENHEVDLVRLDILIHHDPVWPFSRLIVRHQAQETGRKMTEKLKEVLPRQNFAIAIQASIGGTVVARETLPAYRKDVTAKLYGGDHTRKDKLLKKQAKGKKRMAMVGKVEIPKDAFFAVLKNN